MYWWNLKSNTSEDSCWNQITFENPSINVEPPRKTNHLGALNLPWKCAICTKSTVQIAHFYNKQSAPNRLVLLGGSTPLEPGRKDVCRQHTVSTCVIVRSRYTLIFTSHKFLLLKYEVVTLPKESRYRVSDSAHPDSMVQAFGTLFVLVLWMNGNYKIKSVPLWHAAKKTFNLRPGDGEPGVTRLWIA